MLRGHRGDPRNLRQPRLDDHRRHRCRPAISIADQPHAIVERDGVRYTLLGTAHVSKASVDAVRNAIASGAYDTIAVELDPQRLAALTDPDALGKLDLVKVLREGKAALFAANLGLAAYQRRLAEQLGHRTRRRIQGRRDRCARTRPGTAPDRSRCRHHLQARLVETRLVGARQAGRRPCRGAVRRRGSRRRRDRETQAGRPARSQLRRVRRAQPGTVRRRDCRTRPLHGRAPARIRDAASGAREVLAVVGAGHLQGLATFLRDDTRDPVASASELDTAHRKSSIPWFTIILTALLLGGLAWGFWHGGLKVGADLLLQWVVITAGLAARRLRAGRRTSAEHPRRCRRGAVQAVPAGDPGGRGQRAGRSAAAQADLCGLPRPARRRALMARLVSQPRRARAGQLHADQHRHDDRRVDRHRADLRQAGRLISAAGATPAAPAAMRSVGAIAATVAPATPPRRAAARLRDHPRRRRGAGRRASRRSSAGTAG